MSVGGNTKSHDAAHLHVAGESEFVDDRAAMAGEVFVTVIYSPIAKGRIVRLDASAIAADPDFVAFYTHRDLAHNVWGTIFRDQPLLAETEVAFAGEPVALLVTTDRRWPPFLLFSPIPESCKPHWTPIWKWEPRRSTGCRFARRRLGLGCGAGRLRAGLFRLGRYLGIP